MRRSSGYFWIALVILGATLGAQRLVKGRGGEDLAMPLEEIPAQLDGWVAAGSRPLDPDVGRVLGATAHLNRIYTRGDWALELFVAFYGQQRAGEAMHSPRNCLPGSGWEIWRHETVPLSVGGRDVQVNQYSIQNGGERRIVLYWYQTRSRIFASEFAGKAYLIWDAAVNGQRSGSIVRVTLADREGAAAEGLGFSARIIPAVQTCLEPVTKQPRVYGERAAWRAIAASGRFGSSRSAASRAARPSFALPALK